MKAYLIAGALLCTFAANAQSVGIGTTTPAASAMLDITSASKGLLIPRLTSAQRTAITAPAAGLQVYDINSKTFWYHNGTSWIEMVATSGGGTSNFWTGSSNHIYNSNSGRVGIGTPTPLAKLTVVGTDTWGTASFTGSNRTSHFNFGTDEHTYIRGGKAGSNVILSDDGGNVGIGVGNPTNKLEVGGNIVASGPAISVSGLLGLTGGALTLSSTNGNAQSLRVDGGAMQSFAFETGVTNYKPIVINPYGGNVGIGTNYSPSFAKLEVRINSEQRGWAVGTATYNMHTFFGGSGRSANSEGCYLGTSGTVSNGQSVPLHFFTNAQWAQMTLLPNGNVGIGTTDPTYKLSVNGNVRSKEVVVESNWADYVFEPAYRLAPLDEVAAFIAEHQHLPNIPSAKDIEQNGLQVGAVQTKMMEKIEELTLYIIDLQQQIQQLKQSIKP